MGIKQLKTLTGSPYKTHQKIDSDVWEAGIIGAVCGGALGLISAGLLGCVLGAIATGSVSAGATRLEYFLERGSANTLTARKSTAGTKIRMVRNGRAAALMGAMNTSIDYLSRLRGGKLLRHRRDR